MKAAGEIKEKFLLQLRMMGYLHRAAPYYLPINLLNAAVGAVWYILQILFYQRLIDFILYTSPPFSAAALYFLCYYIAYLAFRLFDQWVSIRFNRREKEKTRRYYKKMVYTESAKKKLENYHSAEYLNLLYNAIEHGGESLLLFADRLSILLNSLICFVAVIIIFGRLHQIFIIGAVCSALKNCILNSKKEKIDYRMYREKLPFDRCDTYVHDLFYRQSYVRELRIFPIGDYFIRKYQEMKGLCFRAIKKDLVRGQLLNLAREGIDLLLKGVYIVVLVYLLINHRVTVGEFYTVLSQSATFATYIERLFMFLPAVCIDANYSADIFAVLCGENHDFPAVNGENLANSEILVNGEDLEDSRGCIVCRDLCFSYDGQREVLSHINICLPLDKKIAIVGENGSGKSTFIKILTGLYTPTRGSVVYSYPGFIGNVEELFGSLLQEYRLFPLSIKENVLPSVKENQEGEVEAALRFAGILEKVGELPDGMDTVFTGEFEKEGVRLSGGEQQKIALARAYAKKAPVLILDEPSANLDAKARGQLIEKINILAEERAILLVTHDLRYTKQADLVIFFEEGRVAEFGSPKELCGGGGKYARMLAEQEAEQI